MSVLVLKKYKRVNKISENLISNYYEGVLNKGTKKVLICEFKPDYLNASIIHQLIRDSEKLIKIKNPHLLNLIDFQYDGNIFYGIYDYPSSMETIEAYLSKNEKKDLKVLWKIAIQILTGLSELEKHGLYHGNLNLSSILINEDNHIVLFKTLLPNRVFKVIFNKFSVVEDCIFYAPEFIQRQDYSIRSDIYSFGIILYVFFGKGWPYEYSNYVVDLKKALLKKRKNFVAVSKQIPEKLGIIIDVCLQKDSGRRFDSFSTLMENYKYETFDYIADNKTTQVEENLKKELQESLEKRLKKIIRIIGIFIFGGALLFVTYLLYLWYLTAIPNTTVPNIIGLSNEKAELLLRENGLKSVIAGEWYHSKYPEGIVVDSKPSSGKNVKVNRAVRLFLSKGKMQFLVPELVGRDIVQSAEVLEGYGQEIDINVIDEEYSSIYRKGVIISQSPTYNNVLKPSDNLQVVVSKGFPVEVLVKDSKEIIFGTKNNLKLVIIDFSVLEGWEKQEVSIVYNYKEITEALYHDTHVEGELIHLEFELEENGEIEVYYNDQLAYKEKVRVRRLNKKSKSGKKFGTI